MYVCHVHACCLLRPEEAMWVLGIEPSPLEKSDSAFNFWAISPVSAHHLVLGHGLTLYPGQPGTHKGPAPAFQVLDFRLATQPHLSPSLLSGSAIWNKLANLSESTSSPVK